VSGNEARPGVNELLPLLLRACAHGAVRPAPGIRQATLRMPRGSQNAR